MAHDGIHASLHYLGGVDKTLLRFYPSVLFEIVKWGKHEKEGQGYGRDPHNLQKKRFVGDD